MHMRVVLVLLCASVVLSAPAAPAATTAPKATAAPSSPLGRLLPSQPCGCIAEPVCGCRNMVQATVIDACACTGQPSCACSVPTTSLGYNEPMTKAPNAIPGAAASTANEHDIHRIQKKFKATGSRAGVPRGLVGKHLGSRCGCVHMPQCPCRKDWVSPEFQQHLKFTSKNIDPAVVKENMKKEAKHKKELADADAIALGKKQTKNKKRTAAIGVKSLGPKCGGVAVCVVTKCGCRKYVQLRLISSSRCPCLNKKGIAEGWVAPTVTKKKQHKIVPKGSLSCCNADPCDALPRCPSNVGNVAFASGMSVNVATGIN